MFEETERLYMLKRIVRYSKRFVYSYLKKKKKKSISAKFATKINSKRLKFLLE